MVSINRLVCINTNSDSKTICSTVNHSVHRIPSLLEVLAISKRAETNLGTVKFCITSIVRHCRKELFSASRPNERRSEWSPVNNGYGIWICTRGGHLWECNRHYYDNNKRPARRVDRDDRPPNCRTAGRCLEKISLKLRTDLQRRRVWNAVANHAMAKTIDV